MNCRERRAAARKSQTNPDIPEAELLRRATRPAFAIEKNISTRRYASAATPFARRDRSAPNLSSTEDQR
jgi:hypothetical protein